MTAGERKRHPHEENEREQNLESEDRMDSGKITTEVPPFTLSDLKKAIPAHCFERSLFISSLYLLVDLTAVTVMFLVAYYVFNSQIPWYLQVLFWPAYWACQGTVSFGVWIIAHECGHRSFCESKSICDAVGLVLHSALMVPYHSWRISHAKHHTNTNRMDGDEAFVPCTRKQLMEEGNLEYPNLFYRFLKVFRYLTVGWPLYLLLHARGRDYGRRITHFNPFSPLFSDKDFWDVVVSDLALLGWVGVLSYLAIYIYSVYWLVALYVIPLLIVNMWLVIVTYLQHSDLKIPHYSDDEWTWLRGALCTMDRDYGILNYVFHHLTDAHIAHHMFSKMPHYRMVEATNAMKPILGKYYNFDSTPVWKALWNVDNFCRFVENEGGILWYKTLPGE